MVTNFTNINKTDNYLSPQLTEHKKTTTNDVGNPGHGLGQTLKYGGVKPVTV
jgi:hypothetical protein